MAIGSIIYLDSNVYGYAASGGGDAHQRLLAAEARSLIEFVKLGMLRLVHSGLVEEEIDAFQNDALRKRIRKALPQPREIYQAIQATSEAWEPSFELAKKLGLDEADAGHAIVAALAGAEYLISAEERNFVAKLRNFALRDPKSYEKVLGGLRAVSLLEWHAEVIGHG